MNVICIGEVLWDVFGQAERLGGSAFNFSAHLARLGHQVSFVSAVGTDERGDRILNAMPGLGLSTRYVGRAPGRPTGSVTVSLDGAGQPDFVVHRPAAYDLPMVTQEDIAELFSRPVDWVCFDTLLQMSSEARRQTGRLLEKDKGARRLYDVNLRAGCWEPSLVRELMAEANMIKLNHEEAIEGARILGRPFESLEQFCRFGTAEFGWQGVCITRGADGCALLLGNEYVESKGYAVEVADAVGAGDAFAAAFVHGVGNGWPAARVADFANRVGALVASRAGAIPAWTLAEVNALRAESNSLSSRPSSQHQETT